jgi:hypothetical protein
MKKNYGIRFLDVKKGFNRMGLSFNKNDNGEYRVAYIGNYARVESSAYYTTDLLDALNTGCSMCTWAIDNGYRLFDIAMQA